MTGRSWIPGFLLLAVIWGCSFAFIKVGLEALTAFQVASVRLGLGALTLLAISAMTGTRLPRGSRTWGHLLVVGALSCAIPFTLFAYGEQHLTSVLAGLINAATPLATLAVILVAFPEERPTRDRVTGMLVGFLGVLTLTGVWEGFSSGEALGVLALIGAISCYGISYPYARRYLSSGGESPIALATGQVLLGALLTLPMLAWTGTALVAPLTPAVVLSMIALGSLGSGVAYVLNFRIIAAVGSSVASTVTYLTPVVATLLGVLVLHERLHWFEPVGGAVVILGIAVSQGRLRMRRRVPATAG
ncbi:DMT family transporter [Actinotalea sp.]|uniref:DMT family transporter n=1 Tax=Actinotalea sp. TaxID=1872145 RepID=UPI0035644051